MEKRVVNFHYLERTLLDRVARGWSFEEVQRELEVSPAETRRIAQTAMAKIGAETLTQAACYAVWTEAINPFDTPADRRGNQFRWQPKTTGKKGEADQW